MIIRDSVISETEEYMVFNIDGKRFAMPAADVEHVIPFCEHDISPLPVRNDRILGFLNVRGQIITLANFSCFASRSRNVCVIAGKGEKCFAFIVTEVEGIFNSDSEHKDLLLSCEKITAASLWNVIAGRAKH